MNSRHLLFICSLATLLAAPSMALADTGDRRDDAVWHSDRSHQVDRNDRYRDRDDHDRDDRYREQPRRPLSRARQALLGPR